MKMLEGERYNETEIDNLKMKLSQMHEMQIDELKANHQKFAECLQEEIRKLEANIKNKNEEIEQMIKERTGIRQMLNSEGSRLREEIQSLQYRIKELEGQGRLAEERFEQKLRDKDDQVEFLEKMNAECLANSQK